MLYFCVINKLFYLCIKTNSILILKLNFDLRFIIILMSLNSYEIEHLLFNKVKINILFSIIE